MKSMFLGAAVIAASFVLFQAAPAFAADTSAMLKQCNKNAESDKLPENVTVENARKYCVCLSRATGDQAVIDELTTLMTGTQAERQKRRDSGVKPSQAALDALNSCRPPSPPPAQ
jgi:hypothetical protein